MPSWGGDRRHAFKYTDGRIAKKLKCSRRTIIRHRKNMQIAARLGPSEGGTESARLRQARALKSMFL